MLTVSRILKEVSLDLFVQPDMIRLNEKNVTHLSTLLLISDADAYNS